MNIKDIIKTQIANDTLITFEDIIKEFKQIDNNILNAEEEKDLKSKYMCKEDQYNKSKFNSKITNLDKVTFFCDSLIQGIKFDNPIKIQGTPKDDAEGNVTFLIASYIALKIISNSTPTEEDVKLTAQLFKNAFEAGKLSIETIKSILEKSDPLFIRDLLEKRI